MSTASPHFEAPSLFRELLARFPATARIECGTASYQWLRQWAAELDAHEDVEMPLDRIVLLDAEHRRLVSLDVTQLDQPNELGNQATD